MLYCGPKPRTETFCPSPPVVRVMVMPGRCSRESAKSASGKRPSSSALMESITTAAFILRSRDNSKLARNPVTTISCNSVSLAFEAGGAAAASPPAAVATATAPPRMQSSDIAITGFRLGTWVSLIWSKAPVAGRITQQKRQNSSQLIFRLISLYIIITFDIVNTYLRLRLPRTITPTHMTHPTPSRRQFMQWAAGLSVALGHGWLPESAGAASKDSPHPEAAALSDSRLRIEFDAQMNARLQCACATARR